MAIVVKTPSQVAQEILDNLKSLRPEINTDQQDSDWWIRAKVIGGVISGVYADINRISNDCFPQSARREAVDKHLQVYFGSGLRQPTSAIGNVKVIGAASGISIPANTQFTHVPTGNIYTATSTISIGAALTGSVPVQSISTGQAQNLLPDTSLTIQSPPGGINTTATVLAPGLTDARDVESTSEGAARVLAKTRNPNRGGTATDYANWALAADARVVSAKVNRHIYGLGTVQVIISAGTSDIDTAIDNDLPIIVQPSAELKGIVLNYIESLNPICDIAFVDGPTEHIVNITAQVRFVNGNANSVVTAGLTQGDLLKREIRRAIYKTPIGGRMINGQSALRAADIEEQIDANLSAQPYGLGALYQIVGDRQISIAGGTPNIALGNFEIAIPGTITVVEF